MPYSIRTKDGITLANIPDDVAPDDPRLKEAVSQRRQQMRTVRRDEGIAKLKAENPAEYDPQSAEFQERVNPTSGMGSFKRGMANLGAGMSNFGLGTAQLLLPKSVERAVGITDESIQEKRQRDDVLADSTTGGRLLQIAGEAAPMFAVPAGAVSKGLTSLPKIGAGLARAGVGSRVLPTLMAEGAALGAASGAITPTTEDESTLFNTALGGAGGAAFPLVLKGLGAAVRPFSRALRERGLAKKLADSVDVSPQAMSRMQKQVAKSGKRIVDAPQSTAAITQSDALAQAEMAARANPQTSGQWVAHDEALANARWKALDDVLGNQSTVDVAKKTTDQYIAQAKPEVMKAIRPKKLNEGIDDLMAATKSRLDHAQANRNTWSEVVYRKLHDEIKASNRSPEALWNVRKMLRSWQEGTPPPGLEATRAPKGDRAIQEAVGAIDEVLNRASHKKWGKFMERISEHARKEGEQRAGQNIRNSFLSEATGDLRTTTTKAGNPVVTRAKLAQALETHGKNQFGETLNLPQRDVIDQVLSDLRAEEIFGRVKKAATSGGGSQTAPLAALMRHSASELGGPWFTRIAEVFSNMGRSKQQQLLNQILLDPQDAMLLLSRAQKIKRPLSNAEKRLVYAARSMLNGLGAAQVDALQPDTQQVSQ